MRQVSIVLRVIFRVLLELFFGVVSLIYLFTKIASCIFANFVPKWGTISDFKLFSSWRRYEYAWIYIRFFRTLCFSRMNSILGLTPLFFESFLLLLKARGFVLWCSADFRQTLRIYILAVSILTHLLLFLQIRINFNIQLQSRSLNNIQ